MLKTSISISPFSLFSFSQSLTRPLSLCPQFPLHLSHLFKLLSFLLFSSSMFMYPPTPPPSESILLLLSFHPLLSRYFPLLSPSNSLPLFGLLLFLLILLLLPLLTILFLLLVFFNPLLSSLHLIPLLSLLLPFFPLYHPFQIGRASCRKRV